MATSSKHDHKNVGCHRIGPPLRSGDRVLATIRTRADIDKRCKEKPRPEGRGYHQQRHLTFESPLQCILGGWRRLEAPKEVIVGTGW